MAAPAHPLEPASIDELNRAARIVRAAHPDVKLRFKQGYLHEPPKAQLLPYLRAERAAEQPPSHDGKHPPVPASRVDAPRPAREIYVVYLISGTPRVFDAVVDLDQGKTVKVTEQPPGNHTPVELAEFFEMSDISVGLPEFKTECARLKVEPAQVVAEPWIYGRDDDTEDRRLMQVFFFLRDPKHADDENANYYAFPLDFTFIIDMTTKKLVKTDYYPMTLDLRDTGEEPAKGGLKPTNPVEPEYLPELQKGPPRGTTKPLQVVQPDGASFHVYGRTVWWEKWRFFIGWNAREGIVLYDLTFDGREVFYRLSIPEMYVPYLEGRPPAHRKGAFDFGDVGAGDAANNLGLGCDCLGVIKYFSGAVLTGESAESRDNAVCMHEIDDGIQMKHTNFRNGKAVVFRKRMLQIQQIITAANYEYIIQFFLDQSGEIQYEVRATGILSTAPIDPSIETPSPFGTIVADGVHAPAHSHIFTLRVDPMVDGDGNTVQVSDVEPLPFATAEDKALNPTGQGVRTVSTDVAQSTALQHNIQGARGIKMVNKSKINPVSKTPVGYKLVPIPSQMLPVSEGSWHLRRCEFPDPFYVTQYRDGEFYPGGQWTNSSRGGAGLRSWAARQDKITSPVLWHIFSLMHIPRVEDFPLMPAESIRGIIRPTNFFTCSPVLDVPLSQQRDNKSVLHQGDIKAPASAAAAAAPGTSCCSQTAK